MRDQGNALGLNSHRSCSAHYEEQLNLASGALRG